MNMFLKVSVVLAATIAACDSSAFAGGWGWDRDAGAKARGDFGVPPRSSDRCVSYAHRSRAAVREFVMPSPSSCERPGQPPLSQGDKVSIEAEAAKLMIGDQIVATVTKGQQLTVLKVEGPWVGASTRVGGQEKSGWVPQSDLAVPANTTWTHLCSLCRN